MARDKNSIPTSLTQTSEALKLTLGDYRESLDQFQSLSGANDYAGAKKALAEGHALVLRLKDLHNGLYRYLKAPAKPKADAKADTKADAKADETPQGEKASEEDAEIQQQHMTAEEAAAKAAKFAKPAKPAKPSTKGKGKGK